MTDADILADDFHDEPEMHKAIVVCVVVGSSNAVKAGGQLSDYHGAVADSHVRERHRQKSP